MKINILSTLLFCSLFVLNSCENLFEPKPDNHYDEKRFEKDPSFAEGLLLTAYSNIAGYTFNDVATDDAVINLSNNFTRVALGEWSARFNPLSAWNNAYTQIYYLNYFLSIVDRVEWSYKSAERNKLFKEKHTGEAHALRALYNYYLLQAHAGVDQNGELKGFPILTELIYATDDWKLPRDNFADCVAHIYSDCDKAIALLPNKYENIGDADGYDAVFGATNKNRIDARIVKAIKARVALLAASQAFNQNNDPNLWENAANIAGELLKAEGGLGSLSPTGHKFYLDRNDKDILWRGNVSQNNTLEKNNYPPTLYGNGRINPTQNLVDAFPMINGYPITDASSNYVQSNPYNNRDPRLRQYIVYNRGNYDGRTVYTELNTTQDGLGQTANSTSTGYYLKKLIFENLNLAPSFDTKATRFVTYMRFTEIFLNYAEAANEAWGPDSDPRGYGFTSRDIISQIRKRAGLTQPDGYLNTLTTKESMRELIRNERRIELSFEGFRFWDVRRWNFDTNKLNESAKGIRISSGVYEEFTAESRNYQSNMIYGPIPEKEVLVNPNMTQNKDW